LTAARRLRGGLHEPIYRMLREGPHAAHDVAAVLLTAHFPESLHIDILERAGLDPGGELLLAARPRRDPHSA
jgi:hypothetical protein